MKAKYLFFVLIFISTSTSQAQTFLGINIGKDFSKLYGTKPVELLAQSSNNSPFIFGIGLKQQLTSRLDIVFSVNRYNKRHINYDLCPYNNSSYVGSSIGSIEYKYIRSDLKAQFKVFDQLYLGGGVMYSVAPNIHEILRYNHRELGWASHIVYKFKQFSLEVAYFQNETLPYQVSTRELLDFNNCYEIDNYTRGFSCSLSYYFQVTKNPIKIRGNKKVKCAEF